MTKRKAPAPPKPRRERKRKYVAPVGVCPCCLVTMTLIESVYSHNLGRQFDLYRCEQCQRLVPCITPSPSIANGKFDIITPEQAEQVLAEDERESREKTERILALLGETQ